MDLPLTSRHYLGAVKGKGWPTMWGRKLPQEYLLRWPKFVDLNQVGFNLGFKRGLVMVRDANKLKSSFSWSNQIP